MMKNNYLIIGERDSRRVVLFKEALTKRGFAEPRMVSYLELISGSQKLNELIESGDVVRIESPGKDFEVERALLSLGCETSGSSFSARSQTNSAIRVGSLTQQEISALVFDRGLILPQSQWYRGWCFVLKLISDQLAASRKHFVMNSPEEVAALFDKSECQSILERAGIRMPALLGQISSFEELQLLMESTRSNRVFLKPAHGSSASGIVAYQASKGKHRARSTVEVVVTENAVNLYNSRKVRTYTSREDIETLVNALCAHNLIVQKWYPKASINNKVFDLRVLVVGGRSRHVVVRESKSPFTNLHLLNARGQLSIVKEALGEERYAAVLRSCESAARTFPNCLYVGVDVLVSSDFQSHAIAEVNAFGDLLPGILCDGISTYEAELDAMSDFIVSYSGAAYV